MNSGPLDDVAYLARSEHRAEVIETLTPDGWTRRKLHEETGISQPTLGRILSGFEDRGWITENGTENGREYALTPLGQLLTEEFDTLLDTVRTIRQLREVGEHLPFEEMGFDPSLLRDAKITTARPDDALAHMRRQDDVAEQSDHVRTLCSSFSPSAVQAQRDRILGGEQTGEAIVAGDALDTLTADDELVTWLADLIESDRVTMYRYNEPVPVMLSLFDDAAGIIPLDDDGLPYGAFIETENEEIRTWVGDTLDEYREEAERIRVSDLPA